MSSGFPPELICIGLWHAVRRRQWLHHDRIVAVVSHRQYSPASNDQILQET